MEFIKDHESFKEHLLKQKLWKQLADGRNLKITNVRTWFVSECNCYGKLEAKKSKSGFAPIGMTQ